VRVLLAVLFVGALDRIATLLPFWPVVAVVVVVVVVVAVFDLLEAAGAAGFGLEGVAAGRGAGLAAAFFVVTDPFAGAFTPPWEGTAFSTSTSVLESSSGTSQFA